MTSKTHRVIRFSIFLAIFLAVFAGVPIWMWFSSPKLPEYATIARMDERYGPQIEKLREYGRDPNRAGELLAADKENGTYAQLFGSDGILRADINLSHGMQDNWFAIKPGPTDLKRWRVSTPSVGGRVLNACTQGETLWVQYEERVRVDEGSSVTLSLIVAPKTLE